MEMESMGREMNKLDKLKELAEKLIKSFKGGAPSKIDFQTYDDFCGHCDEYTVIKLLADHTDLVETLENALFLIEDNRAHQDKGNIKYRLEQSRKRWESE
jgi:hypothetical protein